MQNIEYILDVGSSKMVLLAFYYDKNAPVLVAREEVKFKSLQEDEFLSIEELKEVLSRLITNIELTTKRPIRSITVGTPNEYLTCVCKRISKEYVNERTIYRQDVNNLFIELGADKDNDKDYKIINFAPMLFILDGEKQINPLGKRAKKIVMEASFIKAKKSFIDLFDSLLKEFGIDYIEYVSTMLGEANLISNGEQVIILDVGKLNSSIVVSKGDGLILLNSFNVGGQHFTEDLMELTKLNEEGAELIKKKVLLSLDSKTNERYETALNGNNIFSFIGVTNEFVLDRINQIADIVKEILSVNKEFSKLKLYLTGDGLNFKGIEAILSNKLNMQVERFIPNYVNRNVSEYGLMTLISNLI